MDFGPPYKIPSNLFEWRLKRAGLCLMKSTLLGIICFEWPQGDWFRRGGFNHNCERFVIKRSLSEDPTFHSQRLSQASLSLCVQNLQTVETNDQN